MKRHIIEGLKVILVFAAHIMAGSIVFCMVGTGALAVHWFSHWLATQGLDGIVLHGLKGIEWLMFGCDFVATASWSIMSTIQTLRRRKDDADD